MTRRLERQNLVTERRARIAHVRAVVRAQLADAQRRRQEMSQALLTLRKGLVAFRSQLRSRLREMSHELTNRKAIRS